MAKKIKADKRQQTPIEEANILGSKYAELKAKIDELNAQKKQIEESLHQWAVDHPDQFEGQKTVTLDDVKLVWAASTQVDMPVDIDFKQLVRTFPHHVKVSLPVSKCRALEQDAKTKSKLDEMGIKLITEDKFQVKT